MNNTGITIERRFLRLPEVENICGLKKSHIYRLIKSKRFPEAIKLGDRAVAWDAQEVENWRQQRIQARDQGESS